MARYVDTFYRVASRASLRDKFGNEYTGEQLMLALLLHCTGKDRSVENEREVGKLLDDPNLPRKKRG